MRNKHRTPPSGSAAAQPQPRCKYREISPKLNLFVRHAQTRASLCLIEDNVLRLDENIAKDIDSGQDPRKIVCHQNTAQNHR